MERPSEEEKTKRQDLGYDLDHKQIDRARDEAAKQRRIAELGLRPDAPWSAITAEEMRRSPSPEPPAPARHTPAEVDLTKPLLRSRSQQDALDLAEANRAEEQAYKEAGGDAAFGAGPEDLAENHEAQP